VLIGGFRNTFCTAGYVGTHRTTRNSIEKEEIWAEELLSQPPETNGIDGKTNHWSPEMFDLFPETKH
jgi:hypothetical protein